MTDTMPEVPLEPQDRLMGPLEYRSAQTLEVRFPERIVTVLAAPYGVETGRAGKDGRPILETFAPGSFDGVERRANRVKVNRDHDLGLTVGRAVALHPSRSEGLLADLKFSKTPLGDETLELSADGVLDPSVGFAPMRFPDGRPGEQWTENRMRRKVTRAWLGHIAMVPDPAYESARVLEVRMAREAIAEAAVEASSGTPLKDMAMARLLELGYRPRSLHVQPPVT